MIGYIKGRVIGKYNSGKNFVNIVVAPFEKNEFGVAYSVLMTIIDSTKLQLEQTAEFWTYSVHSENDSYLIGLESGEKKHSFMSLVSVSGVGPRTALNIVSQLTAEELNKAILTNDVSVFSRVPGVGKKIASKIVLELAGKNADLEKLLPENETETVQYEDVIATLCKLGYSRATAKETVKRCKAILDSNSTLTTAEKVKLVLSSK